MLALQNFDRFHGFSVAENPTYKSAPYAVQKQCSEAHNILKPLKSRDQPEIASDIRFGNISCFCHYFDSIRVGPVDKYHTQMQKLHLFRNIIIRNSLFVKLFFIYMYEL